MPDLRWGLSSTIKAPVADILGFCAFHIEQGAHRLYIYLDDPDSAAYPFLKAHPKIRVRLCDDGWWRKRTGKRPGKHQVRQSLNATHAYARPADVDWLIHMDVDEYLWPDTTVTNHLALQSSDILTIRVRPAESLAGNGTFFKSFVPSGPDRPQIVNRLYPTFGSYLRGGFLSHTAGKVFVRTGLNDLTIRIHNVYQGGIMNPGERELEGITLLHRHAHTWNDWQAHFRYRLQHGSYRADLPALRPADQGGMNLNDLFHLLEQEGETEGLRAFYDEVMSDEAGLVQRLQAEGLLRQHDLNLESKIRTQFPDYN